MKNVSFEFVTLDSGFWKNKQELNRSTTIHAVYDRFAESGRIAAFNFDYKEGDAIKPHFYWDSDVAKWIEGAAYILKKHPDEVLEKRIDDLVSKIEKNQGADGYFNIYFTVCMPEARFTNRDWHELYCAGHLMEAAVAYAQATGKTNFLTCMEKYADYIKQVFVDEKTAAFATPGHEEIELALIKMYRYTKKKKFLDLAAHFINTRGTVDEQIATEYNQSHEPVREQSEALGHAVRAVYLYTAMALFAKESQDQALFEACKRLWQDITQRKMYITGGIGSTNIGEAFTSPFDLPNDTAYTETCAGIGLMFFAAAMQELENDAQYADVIERVFYNGVLSGLSLDGRAFFYENPLEINLADQFENLHGKRRLPITKRPELFRCSCCPPNINRLLPSLGNYIYGLDGDTLYVNQFVDSTLQKGDISCKLSTHYPLDGKISISAKGVSYVAVRIPSFCDSFTTNKPYRMQNGYAVIEGGEISLTLDVKPKAYFADPRIVRNAGRLAVMRGPIVYCAESVDNGENLHRFVLESDFAYEEKPNEAFGLPTLDVLCKERESFSQGLYSTKAPEEKSATLHLIPYCAFANRGESNMLVWFCAK